MRIANLSDDPAVDGADLVIVGSGINTGAWYPEAMAWLRANAEALTSTTVAVFNTSLNAADPAKQDTAHGYNDAAMLKCAAVASEAFPAGSCQRRSAYCRGSSAGSAGTAPTTTSITHLPRRGPVTSSNS
ncbi:hypothetical protein G7085_10495 [Tessaracoccus sp. HDW20]|uniref:flavodoxin domain-containing protein n=1 Tax=Tessaracoccus coleopterorum TaxID=2714950 RepID=UPI0018D3BD49|nr:hypothetical protein [Tessaracoccus coleopterorum]